MTATQKREPMTAEAFLEWAEARSSGRYQLISGEIVTMTPQPLEQVYVKRMIVNALGAAIAAGRLPCHAFIGGLGVRIDNGTVFVPDALVNRGPPMRRESMIAPCPVIVAEVIAASSGTHDIAVKYANYFRHPGVQHFLLLFIETRIALLHSRSEDETLKSRIAREGDRLMLDPPGIEVAVSDFFAGLDSAFAD